MLYGGSGFGCNVGILVGKSEVLLVDAMKSNASDSLANKIRELTDNHVSLIINTHSDFDHMEGNKFFQKRGAKSLLHENAVFAGKSGDQYIKDRMTLEFDDEIIELYHVESHSFSDLLIYFSTSNVLFMGDTFTNSWYATFNTGGLNGQLETIAKAVEISDDQTIVVPGHGIITNRQSMVKYAETAQKWVARVAELHADKVSVDDMLNDDQLETILNEFVDPSLNKTIPLARVRRFIERTISTELMPKITLPNELIEKYIGSYETEQILLKGDKLLLRMNNPYISQYEIVPLSKTKFHPRASLETSVRFKLNDDGVPIEMTYVTGDEILTFSKD